MIVCFIKTLFPNPIPINSLDTQISCSHLFPNPIPINSLDTQVSCSHLFPNPIPINSLDTQISCSHLFPNPIPINSLDTQISCSHLPIIPQALALHPYRGLIYIDRRVETKYIVRNQDLSCFSLDLDQKSGLIFINSLDLHESLGVPPPLPPRPNLPPSQIFTSIFQLKTLFPKIINVRVCGFSN